MTAEEAGAIEDDALRARTLRKWCARPRVSDDATILELLERWRRAGGAVAQAQREGAGTMRAPHMLGSAHCSARRRPKRTQSGTRRRPRRLASWT